ncbi:tetratricopeptide repeat protein [Roseibium polysiphoniae]|uniref:tetratricopeptide repeat protein n=1 Tax=Roseibium polysiphoniae TaxID=2571221 RepID=UPI0032993BA1
MAPKTAANPLMEKMHKALAYQKQGEIEKAQRLYKLVLKKVPNNPDANHLLGVCYRQLGFPKRAMEYIQKAIKLADDRAPFYANLARTMSDLPGTTPETTLAVTQKALSLDPNIIEAQNLHAIALSKLDRLEEAEEIFQRLIVRNPEHPDAYRNYGILLRDNGDHDKATVLLFKCTQLEPENSDNHVQLARARHEAEQFKQSEGELEAALARFPDDGDICHQMARLQFKLGEAVKGLPYAQKAVKLRPNDPHSHVTLGVHLHSLGRFDEAVKYLSEGVRLSKTPLPAADWNIAIALLAAGRFKEGWAQHAARLEDPTSTSVKRTFEVPEWDGAPLDGRKLLLWNDQGIGDAIRNASFVDELTHFGGKIVLETAEKLVPLCQRSFDAVEVRKGQYDPDSLEATADDYDLHFCLADSGKYLRPDVNSFHKAKSPYLRFDRDRAQDYLARMGAKSEKPLIGIAWRSGNLATWRARWYLSAPEAKPILETPDAIFVNLQYGALARELEFIREGLGVDMQAWDDIDLKDDMDAAAAMTACVDLVITANTSVGDLAGALAVPCWRFGSVHTVILMGEQNPPWFPNTTYYRIQPEERATDVAPRIAADLKDWVGNADISPRMHRLGL